MDVCVYGFHYNFPAVEIALNRLEPSSWQCATIATYKKNLSVINGKNNAISIGTGSRSNKREEFA